ncbi:MAG: hypothetical protein HUU28_16530 [Planctomycetaceae bacterium]|jgi:hypothetical protein|nr:hypothetical protein [Planctomycetaceae bacterium]
MTTLNVYLVALAVGVTLAITVCLIFRRTLEGILTELCGGVVRGRFWMLFGNVGLVLATMWCGLWFAPAGGGAVGEGVRTFTRTLGAAVFGLLAVLVILGLTLQISISRYESAARRAQRNPQLPTA